MTKRQKTISVKLNKDEYHNLLEFRLDKFFNNLDDLIWEEQLAFDTDGIGFCSEKSFHKIMGHALSDSRKVFKTVSYSLINVNFGGESFSEKEAKEIFRRVREKLKELGEKGWAIKNDKHFYTVTKVIDIEF